MSSQLTGRPGWRDNADGYPEDGTHEAKLEWVKANRQLPPYPRQGTALEKNAWAGSPPRI